MADLELTRTPEDRRRYTLDGVGTVRHNGFLSRTATAEANGRTWQFAGRGFWRRGVIARDAAGTIVGEFEPRGMRRGGRVRWADRELTLRPASAWRDCVRRAPGRDRYALADGERELAVLEGFTRRLEWRARGSRG
jgi:hypothetical protein